MPGGRPTTYKPEYIDKIDEYLAQCVDEQYQLIKSEGDKTVSYENKIKVKLPSIEGYSIFIDVALRTIDSWRDNNLEFLRALEKITRKQKEQLIKSGLSGDYNSTIAKLILSSNHGMVERKDMTTDGKQLPTPILPMT